MSLGMWCLMLWRKVLLSSSWVQGFFKTLGCTQHISTKCQEQHTQWCNITSHPSAPEYSPLRRHENWCNCNLFPGHSFGSAVAYMYSALFPDDVEAYVGIDCVRTLMMILEEELLERTRYALDRALAMEKRLASDPPSYTYEELRDLVHTSRRKSPSMESCDILLERGVKKLPADDRWGASCLS